MQSSGLVGLLLFVQSGYIEAAATALQASAFTPKGGILIAGEVSVLPKMESDSGPNLRTSSWQSFMSVDVAPR
jgi:hypothetical protein